MKLQPCLSHFGAFAFLLPAALAAAAASPPSWQDLNGLDFQLSKGSEELCSDGSLVYETKGDTRHLRLGARIQFNFKRTEKLTETSETGPDTSCQYHTSTTANQQSLHVETKIDHCANGKKSSVIQEDMQIQPSGELIYNYKRTSGDALEKSFHCEYKSEKQPEKQPDKKPEKEPEATPAK